MTNKNQFFPKRIDLNPTIYAYELPKEETRKGLLKVGFTCRDAKTRIAEQLKTIGVAYKIVFENCAVKNNGDCFTDHEIHKILRKKGFKNPDGEWFECKVKDLEVVINSIKNNQEFELERNLSFAMRPEQKDAVERTSQYFLKSKQENSKKPTHFLWNAKMRFGKTFTTYQLAKKMGWKKILVLTFKPAVQNAWQEDLESHIDFENWQFIAKNNDLKKVDYSKPLVCFGSFQDYLGKNSAGGIKAKNEWVHTTNWDCVVFDEYHYGAWRENAKDLFESEDLEEQRFAEGEGLEFFDDKNGKNNIDEGLMPITTSHFLYLSGTPFRAISSGEFIEEQIFNWTYSDEQRAKENWQGENNPYLSLPRMVILTYQMPDSIKEIAKGGEFNEFDLNVFFQAKGKFENAKFVYENEVQKWLDLIRGSFLETQIDNLKQGAKKPLMPFSEARLLEILTHTFWFLPSVSSCYAMKNILSKRQNIFYHNYKIIVAAGKEAGIGAEALKPVIEAMENPLQTKTITLSCGKLTTGVSVKPWSGIFMLRNSSSPETYFQAAFRVQTPWQIKNPDDKSPNKIEIIKEECYVFDFAPNRALRQIADYGCRLNIDENNPEKKVEEFINFLPIWAYDGSSTKQINAAEILDIAFSGTTATLLARRWESALLVNVDNATLSRLMASEKAMNALMSIEGFRTLNQDIETIINKSESIKKIKKEANERDLSPKEKKELSDEEKEFKSKRKQIQEKLIKFSTRIPVFMYLTDYREKSLKDVIMQLEPQLFKKVTGLNVDDFDLLVSLGVFNDSLMNDAVCKFKKYEDKSLSYAGLWRHKDEDIGLFSTTISSQEFIENL
jgi:hypothetical protein